MPDYKKMYFQLFSKVTDAINLLQQAQQQAEDSFVLNFPPDLSEAKTESPAKVISALPEME